MKHLSFLLLVLLSGFLSFGQTSGGPDTYGYTWIHSNSTAPNAPTYNWVNISTIGTLVAGLGDDNSVGPFNIGFPFRYYWSDYTQFWIGSNGYIGFQPLNISSAGTQAFPTMPTNDANNNFVAPMLSDLSFATPNVNFPNPATARIWTNNIDSCVVTFQQVPFWVNTVAQWSGINTFQVIFSGQDSSITFQYQTQLGTYDAAYAGSTNPVVVGIENVTGNIGLTVSNNTLPAASTAVKFFYPDSVTLSVPDVAPVWVQNDISGGFFAINNALLTGQSLVSNVGNTNLTGNTSATLNILDNVSSLVHSETQSVPPLPLGMSQVAAFNQGYTPANTGTYTYRVTTTNTADINVSNNLQTAEMVVVDTVGTNLTLSYYNGTPPSSLNIINWTGGGADDGVGVYYEPPIYPLEITEVEAYVFFTAAPTTANAFEIRVYDDDAPPGQGTLLGSAFMPSANAVNDAWNTVPLASPIKVDSGGFYVGWYQTGGSIQLGQELTLPISKRSYEVLNDDWGTFRFNSTQESLLRVKLIKSCNIAAGTYSLGADTAICAGNLLTLDPGVPGGTYSWSTGASSPTINVDTTGLYIVEISDANGCYGTDSIQVSLNPTPVLDLGPDVSGCQGDTFEIGANMAFASYQWSSGQTDSSILVHFNTGVTLSVLDSNGCGTVDNINITINPPPQVDLGPDQLGCFQEGGTVTVSTQILGSYLWSDGSTNDSLTLAQADTVWLQVTDVNGCLGADTIGVRDNTPSIDLGPDMTGCEGTAVSLSAATGFSSYAWSNGATSANTNVTAAGSYSVVVLNNTGCSATDTIEVNLEPLPDPNFNASGGWGINWFDWSFTNTSSGATSYTWNFGDGTPGSTAPNPSHQYAFDGQYDVKLVATNDCGSDSITIRITVTNTDGLEDLYFGEVLVYPSPNHGQFQVQFGAERLGQTRIRVYNLQGQVVYVQSLFQVSPQQKVPVALEQPVPGMYLLELETEGVAVFQKMLVR